MYEIARRERGSPHWTVRLLTEDGAPLYVYLTLQYGGAVLVEASIDGTWYSCYTSAITMNGGLTNRMYQKNDFFALTPQQEADIKCAAGELREAWSDWWDEKYAPGPDFTGGEV